MLQRTDLDADTRSKLELTLAVRGFARDTLHLLTNGSYASYARVDADQTVHVVTAADRFRLQPYTWWFPIVGRVPYKGFFSDTDARAEAASLEGAGYDTSVRPSVAFSTLGWFADPLVSTLLRYDRVTLANVIIHELLHSTTYLAGRAEFDESFANFVGHRGAILFFTAGGDDHARQAATAEWDDALRFSDFLGRFTTRLRAAYASGIDLAERQRLFVTAQEEFRRLPFHTGTYQSFATQRLNNAVILQYATYAERLQLFEDLFQQREMDLTRTIAVVLDAIHKDAADPFTAVQAEVRETTPAAAGYGSMVASRAVP